MGARHPGFDQEVRTLRNHLCLKQSAFCGENFLARVDALAAPN